MKRILLLFFLLFPFSAGAQVDLHFWHFSIDEKIIGKVMEDFSREHPDIQVHVQQLSWDFGHDKIVTSLIAKNAPDVFEIGSTWGPKFAEAGVLRDITADISAIQSDYLMWEPVTHKNRVYGIPWLLGTRFLFYNKDLFKKAGLDFSRPPATWKEVEHAAKRIHALSSDTFGYGLSIAEDFAPWQMFLPLLWNRGGAVLDPTWTRSQLSSEATIDTIQFLKRLKPYSLLNRQSQLDQLFSAGKIGILLSGPWNFKAIARTNKALSYGVGMMPVPKSSQTPISFGGGEMLVMLNQTKHPKEALLFMKYLASRKVEMTISAAQLNVLPSLKSALKDPMYQKDEKMRVFANQMLNARPVPAHEQWLGIGKLISSGLDEILLEDKAIEPVLLSIDSKTNNLLQQSRKAGTISDESLTLWIVGFMALIIMGLFLLRNKAEPLGARSSWLFVSPWVLLFVVFGLYPLIYSLVISFADYNVLTSHFSFLGINNYINALKDPEFVKALGHTLLFAVGTIPFTVCGALLLAALIHQGVPWKGLFQAGFFLPVVTSIIVIAMLFTFFYAENGFLNYGLTMLGLPRPKPSWLINKSWALVSIMGMAVWSSVGYYLILFLAGLQAIPKSLYEASRLDGAGAIQQFFKITLPQLKTIILFVIVINTINSLQVFPEIFTMTKGGPARSTTTVVYYLYEKGFSEFQMGMASSIAYLLAIVIGFFAYIQMNLLKERS